MEYKDIYEDLYNKTYLSREQEIKIELINAKSESRAFNYILNLILSNTEVLKTENNIISNINLSLLEETYRKKIDGYSENAIELTLKNDIYPEYLKLNEDELPSEYSFLRFVGDLGFLYALNEVNRLFRHNKDLFEMMFDLNDFSDFEIKEYGMILGNTPIFKNLYNRRHPDNVKINNKSKIIITKINIDDSDYTELEKAFLFYVMCKVLSENKEVKNENQKFNLPYTELIRLNTIIDFKDNYCFGDSYNDSNNYKILAKGIIHFDKDERISFLTTLIEKIKIHKLSKTTKHIKEILNNEYNKIRKTNMK